MFHFLRIRRSTSRISCSTSWNRYSTSSGFRVPLPPESAFHFVRITHAGSSSRATGPLTPPRPLLTVGSHTSPTTRSSASCWRSTAAGDGRAGLGLAGLLAQIARTMNGAVSRIDEVLFIFHHPGQSPATGSGKGQSGCRKPRSAAGGEPIQRLVRQCLRRQRPYSSYALAYTSPGRHASRCGHSLDGESRSFYGRSNHRVTSLARSSIQRRRRMRVPTDAKSCRCRAASS